MSPEPDKQILLDIVNKEMPYGKYAGRLICNIPIHYLEWMAGKEAWPNGRMGILLKTLYEIKLNNLDYILHEIKSWRGN